MNQTISPKRISLADNVLQTPNSLSSRGYTVVERIASSNSNMITKVKDNTSGQEFICKAMTLQNLHTAKAKLAAQQEVSILKALQHPNVIGYRDSFVVDEKEQSALLGTQLVIIMELATSGDLREKRLAAAAENKRIQTGILASWFRQMLLALEYIHGCRMVHRDLKSANVFISNNRILVGDFGITKVLESTLFATTCVGTPAYMAPEIVRSEKYSSAVDIWAVGVIAYEMLLLELPFNADSLLGLVYQIANTTAKLPPPGKTSGTAEGEDVKTAPIHHNWHDLISRCMNKDSSQRPSATELLNSVELLREEYCSANILPDTPSRAHSPGGLRDFPTRKTLGSSNAGSSPLLNQRKDRKDSTGLVNDMMAITLASQQSDSPMIPMGMVGGITPNATMGGVTPPHVAVPQNMVHLGSPVASGSPKLPPFPKSINSPQSLGGQEGDCSEGNGNSKNSPGHRASGSGTLKRASAGSPHNNVGSFPSRITSEQDEAFRQRLLMMRGAGGGDGGSTGVGLRDLQVAMEETLGSTPSVQYYSNQHVYNNPGPQPDSTEDQAASIEARVGIALARRGRGF